jgi:FAD binding domain
MRAIIIGGGIGGLAAAVALRQVGIEAVVYERATELREVGAGLILWPNALRVLEVLGLAEAVRAVSLAAGGSALLTKEGVRLLDGPTGAALADCDLSGSERPPSRRRDQDDAGWPCRPSSAGPGWAAPRGRCRSFRSPGSRATRRERVAMLRNPCYHGCAKGTLDLSYDQKQRGSV